MPQAVPPKPLPRDLEAMLATVGDRLAKVVAAIHRSESIDDREIAALAAGGPQGVDRRLRQLVSSKLYGRSLERLDESDRQAIENL